jgi:hypothetical protein
LRDGLNMGVEMLMVRWNNIREFYEHPSIALDEASLEPGEPVQTAK